MSVIRHTASIRGQVSRDRTQMSRDFRRLEKVLFVGRTEAADEVKRALESNQFEVHITSRGAHALRAILENDFAAVICDTTVPNFPFDTFYMAVERIRPSLLSRFIFLIESETDPRVVEFIERVDGLKVWHPIEMTELFQMIEIILGRNALPEV